MTIYNKALAYSGVALFAIGVSLDYFVSERTPYNYIFLPIGIILMLFSFKKPKREAINDSNN